MDLAGMINDGAEALHRGSVDKSGSAPPTPVLDMREGAPPSDAAGDSALATPTRETGPDGSSFEDPELRSPKHKSPDSRPAGPGAQGRRVARQAPPVWARVYRGSRNKVRDPRRWKLAETRPELTEMFADTEEPPRPGNGARAPPPDAGAPAPRSAHGIPPSPFQPSSVPAATASDIGPGGNLSLTGLSASLAGLIPNDDQTKVLAGWLFERIEQISDRALLPYVEVEFKMGVIADDSDIRHRFPVLSEAVIDPVYWRQHGLKFKTAIDESAFRALETLLDSLEVANATNERNPITKSNQLVTDEVFSIQHPELNLGARTRVRVSRDDHGRVVECIHKQRIGDLFLSLPNAPFDLKMSMSLETPVDFEQVVAPKIRGVPPAFERNKNRLKWAARGCTVDLTSVHSRGVGGTPQVIKEGEIEANMELLGAVLQECRDSRNKAESLDKFLEVIRYTIDSARFLLRNI